MSLLRSLLLVLALALVIGACKNSTSPNDGGGTNTTDSSRLILTKSGADTVFGVPGSSVTISFNVSRSGKPVDSAAVSYFDPITGSSLISERTVAGAVTVTLDIPATTTSGDYPARFFATKRDIPMSDTLRMVLHVDGRATLKMSLRARGEANGIGLEWTRTASDRGIDTAILVSQSGAMVRSIIPSPGAEAHFSGLTQGEVYTLYVNSAEAFSEHIQWALSKRYGPRRVSEGEGIDLASGNVMSAAADPSPVDVILATDPTSVGLVSLISPAFTKLSKLTNGRNTQFSDFYLYGQSLDSIYFQRDLSTKFDSDVNVIELDEEYHPSLIFQVLTSDKHYAQVGIIPQPNGHLIGIDASNHRFVDLQVSYQPIANLPYAARGARRVTRRIVAHQLGKR